MLNEFIIRSGVSGELWCLIIITSLYLTYKSYQLLEGNDLCY